MIIFVTGGVDTGKTTLMLSLARNLTAQGLRPGGVLARKKYYGSNRIYSATDIFTGKSRKLLEVRAGGIKEARGGFAFAATALKCSSASRITIVDEFGPMELAGKGHFKAVGRLVRDKGRVVIIVLRSGILKASVKALGLKKYEHVLRRGRSCEKKIISLCKKVLN